MLLLQAGIGLQVAVAWFVSRADDVVRYAMVGGLIEDVDRMMKTLFGFGKVITAVLRMKGVETIFFEMLLIKRAKAWKGWTGKIACLSYCGMDGKK